jgi:2-amino-4-hydroxy-6-hydroxymethyldihydropteridine diphosphokinase
MQPVMQRWQPAYIGLGSNLSDPEHQVLTAARQLEQLPATCCVRVSPAYVSRPFGPIAQPDFVNAVAGLLTRLTSRQLLDALRSIETAFGRPAQHQRWGPRILDLDLLCYGRERSADGELTLPHPGIVERNFVLYPLADIAPDLELPGLGRVTELKARVSFTGLTVL